MNLEERIHFTKLLRNLTIHKRKIEEAMVFCIFNIENAVDICAIITVILGEICFSENVSEEKILPYLYLLSDIFFNSTTSMYRDIMKIILPNFIFKASEKI